MSRIIILSWLPIYTPIVTHSSRSNLYTSLIMKAVVALAVFACVAAMVAADGYGYGPELKPV